MRGRRAEAAYLTGPIIPGARPEPPDDLTPKAADEWRKIVDCLPPETFSPELHGLLREYCCHLDYSQRVRVGIEAARIACENEGKNWALDDAWLKHFSELFAE